jgi:glycosyltransferase involved in cell wall biosynthesis
MNKNIKKNGFNLIGYASSPMGLGEDLRSFAAILEFLNINYSVIDLPTESQGKVALDWMHKSKSIFQNNVFFMSPIEFLKLHQECPWITNKKMYSMGYFLWELPDLPPTYRNSLELVDQIWCPTKFVQEIFATNTNKLVLRLPLPVISYPTDNLDYRLLLNIPNNSFVCLYIFDSHSTMHRKNPNAVINSFIKFSKIYTNSFLILKINRPQELEMSFIRELESRPNIRIISENLSTSKLQALYTSADCYLSMHRSEGFGRTIVEAMRHGLGIVSTNYSGPADFLNESNCALVDWIKVDSHPNEYPNSINSSWADPSIDSAVAGMIKIIKNREFYKKNSILTASFYSVEEIGNKYRKILSSYLT